MSRIGNLKEKYNSTGDVCCKCGMSRFFCPSCEAEWLVGPQEV